MQSEEYPNLHILPVGTIPTNPTELLSSKRLEQLIAKVRGQYDFVLIDCPPASILADVDIIKSYADRTLFIIRAGFFARNRLPKLESDVANGRYKHLSVILNASNLDFRYGYHFSNCNSYWKS